MKRIALSLLVSIIAAAWPRAADAALLPKNHDFYLMEDDLVYARFLALARDGTYRQINRDAHGSFEVDRGRWTEDGAGVVVLNSTCHALRPRSVRSGPLFVVITDPEQVSALPRLVAAVQRLLADHADGVFDATTLAQINVANAPAVRIEEGSATFDRADVSAIAARASEALESERTGGYHLIPIPHSTPLLFTLPGSVFQGADLANVRRAYKVKPMSAPPFYFARVDAKKYAAEVGRVRPLHLPGNLE